MLTIALELPAQDVVRACAFYRELLGFDRSEDRAFPIAFRTPVEQDESAAASQSAPLRLQLTRWSALDRALQVAWERGGRILECSQRTGQGLWSATIVDTEGNVVSLQAREWA